MKIKSLILLLIVFCCSNLFGQNRSFDFDGKTLTPLDSNFRYNEATDSMVVNKAMDTFLFFKRAHVLRHFYFQWSYWTQSNSAWGENDIFLNHYPTKKEIILKYVPFDKDWIKSKIEVSIQEVNNDELHKLLSRDGIDRIPVNIKSHYNLNK